MSRDGVGLRTILGIRGFRLLLSTRLTGQFGDGLLQAALATFVLFSPERQPTAAKVAVAFAILLLPYSLIGPFAGVLLDRWQRRTILIWANITRAIMVIGVAGLVLSRHDDALLGIWVLMVLGANRFILAALSASLPHVVADRYLVTGNAVAPTAGTMASVTGGLAGVTIGELVGGGERGSAIVLTLAIGAYLVASLIASRQPMRSLGPDSLTERETVRGVVTGMSAGFAHLRARAPAARAIGLVMVHRLIFGIALALCVLQVRGALHPDDADAALRALTLTTGAAGGGAFLGAVLTPALSRRLGAVRWSALTLIVAVPIAALALAPGNLIGLLVGGFFVGLAGQSVKVCSDTIVQEDIDDDRRGRVFALYDVAVNIAIVTGVTLTSFVAPLDGRAPGMCAFMVITAIAGAAWAIRAERRDPARSYAPDPAAIP
ncbi:MAG: MFS transporter [Actinomycetes bacterium]